MYAFFAHRLVWKFVCFIFLFSVLFFIDLLDLNSVIGEGHGGSAG